MFGGCIFILGYALGFGSPSAVVGVDGHIHHLVDEAKGKPHVILFISHDCPICNAYAPEIGRLQAKYGKRVTIDLVYSETRITAPVAKNHAKEFALDRSSLFLDPEGVFAQYCKATVTPQAVLFDAQGKTIYSGRIDDRYVSFGKQRTIPSHYDLRDALEAVLFHKRPKTARTTAVGCYIVLPSTS